MYMTYVCDIFICVWHEWETSCHTYDICAWHGIHMCVWRDFVCVCDMTLYVCVTWLCMCVWHDYVCVCDMTMYVCVTWLCKCVLYDFVCVCDTTLYVCDMTLYVCVTCLFNMGWLRLVGSLKMEVSFTKEPYTRDYILQKKPIILRSLLIIATPHQDAWLSRLHTWVQTTGLFCRI